MGCQRVLLLLLRGRVQRQTPEPMPRYAAVVRVAPVPHPDRGFHQIAATLLAHLRSAAPSGIVVRMAIELPSGDHDVAR